MRAHFSGNLFLTVFFEWARFALQIFFIIYNINYVYAYERASRILMIYEEKRTNK